LQLRCCPVEREKPVDDTTSLLLLGRRPSPVASSFMRFYCCCHPMTSTVMLCAKPTSICCLLLGRALSSHPPRAYVGTTLYLLRCCGSPPPFTRNTFSQLTPSAPGARFLTNLQSKALLGLVKFIFIFSFVKFDSSTYKILHSSFLFVDFISIFPIPLTPHLA